MCVRPFAVRSLGLGFGPRGWVHAAPGIMKSVSCHRGSVSQGAAGSFVSAGSKVPTGPAQTGWWVLRLGVSCGPGS